ncbi:MAG TPA: hypothetical protein ENK18_00545 [Deltaproteobacteria bacterium]|nr:hypothetical protein [Deltaproteobacteria bacterium]
MDRRTNTIHLSSILILGLLWAPGCGLRGLFGGSRGEGSQTNRVACESYVAHMNTLTPCMGVSYEVDNFCAGANASSVDMVPYYRCLQENSSCDGTEPVYNFDDCEPPTEVM